MAKHLQRLVECWALLGGLILLVIVLVTSLNVTAFSLDRLARLGGAGIPALPGYEDFVRLAISAGALMFLPLCQFRRGHVVVDLIWGYLPQAAIVWLDRLGLLSMAAMALYLAGWMVVGAIETCADGVLSPVLGWPEWPFYLPGIVSLLLWAAVAIQQAAGGSAADGANSGAQ